MRKDSKKTFYITTPIYYPNGKFHIGNSYTTIICDVIARYQRSLGKDVLFTTGNDEHGLKIQKSAQIKGLDEQQYVDHMAIKAQNLWNSLCISIDKFVRTSSPSHKKFVEEIFDKLCNKGDIYLGEYVGWYSIKDEEYFSESQLKDKQYDNKGNIIKAFAPSGHTVELIKEECYFLNVRKYSKKLIKFLNSNKRFAIPSYRLKELFKNFIDPGLQDLAITRTSFSWGVNISNNPKHVVYVWIDALLSYLSTVSNKRLHKYWPPNLQVIGKEITRFHLIYWPILLMALDLPLPDTILAHGWIYSKDMKMSKSKNNIVYPEPLINKFGVDSLRYYLIREIPLGEDGTFTPESFVNRYNYDLANDLGNLVNRTLKMINIYFNGKLCIEESERGRVVSLYKDTLNDFNNLLNNYFKYMDEYRLTEALKEGMIFVNLINKFIEQCKPWKYIKEKQLSKVESDMILIASLILNAANLLSPFIPCTCEKIFFMFNTKICGLNLINLMKFNIHIYLDIKVTDNTLLFPRYDKDIAISYINQM